MSNEPAAVETPATAARGGRGAAFIALGIAAAATLAGITWISRIYAPAQARLEATLAGYDQSSTSLGGELHALRERLGALERAAGERDATLAAVREEATRLAAEIAAPAATAADLLRLTRIEHLVRSADFALRLSRDPRTADAALELAARELDGGDPREAALLQSLADARAGLSALAEPDVSALAAQWVAHAARVERLQGQSVEAAAPAAAPSAADGWQGIVREIWRDLRALVEIRSTEAQDRALLDPSRLALARMALRNEITLLRAALVARDDKALAASSTAIASLLATHFDTASEDATTLLEALAALDGLALAPPLPSLADSLSRLAALRAASGAPEAPSGDPRAPPAAADPTPLELPTGPREVM